MLNKNDLFRRRKLVTFIVVFSLFAPILISINNVQAYQENTTNDSFEIQKTPSNENELSLNALSVNITEYSEWDDNFGNVVDVYVNDNFLYITLGSYGFVIYNITDLNPQFLYQNDDYSCNHIYRQGNYLYTSNYTGLTIYDATDINNLVNICNWTGAITNIYEIYASGNYVYFTDSIGLKSLNITNLLGPQILDTYSESGLSRFKVSDGIAYVQDTNRARFVNITDPEDVYLISSTPLYSGTDDICYSDGFVYLCDSSYTYIYNVTILSSPVIVSTYTLNNTGDHFLSVVDDYLYIGVDDGGIVVVDVSNKTNPLYYTQKLDTITINNFISYGDYLFLYNAISVEILDISTPSAITSIWFELLSGESYDIYVVEDTLFLADDTALEIIDITNPAKPKEISTFYDKGESIIGVYAVGDYAYIIEENVGLKILDISNINNPIELGNWTFNEDVSDIYVTQEYAYLAQGTDGIAVIDIYYPDYPQKSLQYEEYSVAWALEFRENYLYVAAGEYFHILDMSNPFKPVEVGNWTRTDANYYDIFLTEDYAYLVCDEGFDIVDITTPATPVKVGQFFNWKTPMQIMVNGKYAYLLNLFEGLEIYDVSNIAHPLRIALNESLGLLSDMWASNGYIYLADGSNGLQIYQTEPLLTVKSGISPFVYVGGLVFFSIIGLLLRKKKR
ncbi:MAG: LVIVD repeat-containing protein [Candidatus Thorarchaeota archaeon]